MITVFVADSCPHCAKLLADLERRGVAFRCVNLSQEPERLGELTSITWERRVPVVVDHERCSVGFAGGSSSFEDVGISRVPPSKGKT